MLNNLNPDYQQAGFWRSGKLQFSRLAVSFLMFFMIVVISTAVCAEPASFSHLLDTTEEGISINGNAEGTVEKTFNKTANKDILKFNYSIPKESSIGAWIKNLPAGLKSDAVNTVKLGVDVPDFNQPNQISLKLELKGTKGTQEITLSLQPFLNSFQKPVNWEKVGDLEEIVFVVTPKKDLESVKGTLYLNLDFINIAPSQTSGTSSQGSSSILVGTQKYEVFKTGDAEGSVKSTFNQTANKNVLQFNYSISKGAVAGTLTKSFPPELWAEAIDTVKIGVDVPDFDQVNQISLKVEIKGTKGTQEIQLALQPFWNSYQKFVEWDKIGELKEVVFAVSPKEDYKKVKGTLYFSFDFIDLSSSLESTEMPPGPSAVSTTELPEPAITGQTKGDTGAAFNIMDAREYGGFNIGNAGGDAYPAFDKSAKKDVLEFNYYVHTGSTVGVWTKSYPSELGPDTIDAVKMAVMIPDPEQLNQISITAELKGENDVQKIPLHLGPGWNFTREAIDWNKIGNLQEAVYAVTPIGSGESVEGTLYVDFDFYKLSLMQKYFTLVKVGLILIVSLLIALLMALFGKGFSRRKSTAPVKTPSSDEAKTSGSSTRPILSRLKEDFFYGIMAVIISGVAFWIYSLGAISAVDAGFAFSFLVIGVMGAVIAELLKYKYTGEHLTPVEVFQNILVTGLLAAASSNTGLLQAPSTWSQLFVLSNVTSTIFFLIYHLFNAYSLASSRRHVRPIVGTLIVGTPFLLGWLLLLENVKLLQSVSNTITGGLLAASPSILTALGRFIIMVVFNEIVMNGISLAIKGKPVKKPQVHILVLFVSLGVVIAPIIANLGSTAAVGSLPVMDRAIVAIVTTMFAFAGLWGEVYLITGIFLDCGHRVAPSKKTIPEHVLKGVKKGLAYAGILMAILYGLYMALNTQVLKTIAASSPVLLSTLAGALIFPLLKTIIESFDGSQPFFNRLRYSYKNLTLYARGAVIGFGFTFMITQGVFQKTMGARIKYGLLIGFIASGGISILRDAVYALKGRGKIQSWRMYFTDSILGIFVGVALGFYLDARQVPVVIAKFKLYTSSGFSAVDYVTYPLVNKWGRIDLGNYTGGVKLIFLESLAGVINWSIAAWLFAINKVFLQAILDKDKSPIKFFFSKEGFAQLIEHMIFVLRWGLWMSPIIFTFLRMMPNPTWYNQDGAIRTIFAMYKNVTLSPEAFQQWSLNFFVYIMAFNFLRVLIWMDHMGLRVATLVNLSFLGLDKLDGKVAKFIGPAVSQRYIPEAVKRFCTWAPLLIPFYLPRGKDWQYAWSSAEAIQNASRRGGIIATLKSLSLPQMLLLAGLAVLACTGFSFLIRSVRNRLKLRKIKKNELNNRRYKVVLKENGEIYSEVLHLKKEVYPREHDVSRRSYDNIDPSGRILYLVDTSQEKTSDKRFWPVIGNCPEEIFKTSRTARSNDALHVFNTTNGIQATIDISLPDRNSTAEMWTINIENMTDKPRQIKCVPYLEWVLNGGLHDRFHTQYARLFPEMEYVSGVNAVLARQRSAKASGFLAVDEPPEGFLTSRMDFIGRARSIWRPRIFEKLDFLEAQNTAKHPTFDPIGSMMINAELAPKATKTIRLMIGYAKDKERALYLIHKFLKPKTDITASTIKKKAPVIGHGEIPPGTAQPYADFIDNGKKLLIHTPFTPRPFDHGMSNALHSVMVTNRGLHTSCNGNSQQNRLTPDWPDTVTKEIPAEAIYLYDPDNREWYSPAYHPLNDTSAETESEFGVDGTAVFRMKKGDFSTELTVFVPPDDPLGVYLLKVKNNSDIKKRIRIAPYFQMVLEFQPERSGKLQTRYDKTNNALFFENPRNMFRNGCAFASMTLEAECVETKRGRFFGTGRSVAHPYMVEKGEPDKSQLTDDRQIAGFLGTVEIPAQGECTIAVILGETDKKKQAAQMVQKYKTVDSAQKSLDKTRKWWLSLMRTLVVKTNQPEFDRYQNWLKYQALAERIWARRGFYQTSGAFGFRDQLQDTVNLIWVDPALARKQILLHASHQFMEGDVFHWFFTLTDGRTAFSCRSHASDNPVWLVWSVVEYVNATGDESFLDEKTSYVSAEFPFSKLPKNKEGWGMIYHRSTRVDPVYRHCLRSIDLVLKKRMGKNGLPLIQTGDWNDGLDAIGAEGEGESVWLGFFLYYNMKNMLKYIEKKDGKKKKKYYEKKLEKLKNALEATWRNDRYLRAYHDNKKGIGVEGSGIWETDALTAAWAVMCNINPEREEAVFNTALRVLEREKVVLLGWPALREDSQPYLGRSSKYPEGVRENGMYCHGVQWLIKAARILAERFEKQGDSAKASNYRDIAYRLWLKITPISHVRGSEIENYGGMPNKQPADILTTYDVGRMIWHGYTGAAGWLLRQSCEGVIGATLSRNKLILPDDLDKPRGELKVKLIERDVKKSPLNGNSVYPN